MYYFILDDLQAFVLTRGTTHYRTEDRGKSWRPFEVPIPPALVAKPLAFHSDLEKYGYVLYQGTVCDKSGWGAVCHDEVSRESPIYISPYPPLTPCRRT
jgi:hypothetical protein